MNRRSVLVVDDDVDIREVLAEILEEGGFDVGTAANGREALDIVRDKDVQPSAILLDLMMPILDGYGFLERRRLDSAVASIPVAIITAGHGVDRHRIGEGVPIIAKPFTAQQVIDILQRLVSRPIERQ